MTRLLMMAAVSALALAFTGPSADASPRKAAGASQTETSDLSARKRRTAKRYRYSRGYARPYFRYRYGSPYYAYPRAILPYYAYSYGYRPHYYGYVPYYGYAPSFAYQPYGYVGPYGW